MQVFTDDGVRIDVLVQGPIDAHAIVLIHGFPFTRAVWDAQTESLTTTARVVRLDLRGCGMSSVPEGPYLMERLAADVSVVLDTLGIDRATIVGHSMGGYVALAFARMFTERVARLALVASRLGGDAFEQAAARRALADRTERANTIEPVVKAYLPRMFAPQTRETRRNVVKRAYAIARTNTALGAAATLRGMAMRAASDDIAGELNLPALVIAGERDVVVSLEESRAIARCFPRGKLIICAQSGHLPNLEEPERVSAALAAWLLEP